jgi:hypothetical protein
MKFCNAKTYKYSPMCPLFIIKSTVKNGRNAVAHLVDALRYEPEGRGFDIRWCH